MTQYDTDYPPRLVDHNGDMNKRWYIDFRIWDTDKEAFVRKQYCGMNKFKTYSTRYNYAKKKLKEIADLIKQGYTIGEAKVSVKIFENSVKLIKCLISNNCLLSAFEIQRLVG